MGVAGPTISIQSHSAIADDEYRVQHKDLDEIAREDEREFKRKESIIEEELKRRQSLQVATEPEPNESSRRSHKSKSPSPVRLSFQCYWMAIAVITRQHCSTCNDDPITVARNAYSRYAVDGHKSKIEIASTRVGIGFAEGVDKGKPLLGDE